MWIWSAVAALGILISLGTFAAASSSPNGGGYLVAWGAVLFGSINAIRYAVALRRAKRLPG